MCISRICFLFLGLVWMISNLYIGNCDLIPPTMAATRSVHGSLAQTKHWGLRTKVSRSSYKPPKDLRLRNGELCPGSTRTRREDVDGMEHTDWYPERNVGRDKSYAWILIVIHMSCMLVPEIISESIGPLRLWRRLMGELLSF